ncbi:MAG: transposase, partial [Steroidobacteraceae bacterium]
FVEGLLTGGNVHDVTIADTLFEDVVGCYVVEDMGYDSDPHRRELAANNNIPVIPGRKNRKIPIEYDKKIYKLRKRIEMFFGKIKENKRVTMRFEKLDETFLGFVALASLKIILNSIIS